jgi:PIN domain nuclease of toxin-antitoxin system
MPVVLDTHVWIWLAEGAEPLHPRVIEQIDEARDDAGVFVSAVSLWELAMADARRRVQLSRPCAEWIEAALGPRSVDLVPLTPAIAIDSVRLPGDIHGDPMDRIIVATARSLGATLVTHDRRLVAYGRAGHLDVLEA